MRTKSFSRGILVVVIALLLLRSRFSEDHDHMCSTSFERKSWSWSSVFFFPLRGGGRYFSVRCCSGCELRGRQSVVLTTTAIAAFQACVSSEVRLANGDDGNWPFHYPLGKENDLLNESKSGVCETSLEQLLHGFQQLPRWKVKTPSDTVVLLTKTTSKTFICKY